MVKRFFMKTTSFLLFLLILLAACSPAAAPSATAPAITTEAVPGEYTGCTAVNIPPTPGAEAASIFPPVSADDHVAGPADAAVTMIIYSDFQCPSCAVFAGILEQLLTDHPADMRLVFRHLPLTAYYDKSSLAARAAEAAALQGVFWPMHDLLFERQAEWVALAPAGFEVWLAAQAAGLGLDGARFQADLQSAAVLDKVRQATEFAAQYPLPPLLLINGELRQGLVSYDSLDQTIRLIALGRRQVTACPPVVIDPLRQYIATLHTAKGEAVIQLYPDKAPLAVNSFVFLARRGWFDGITFHRVIPGFVAQTGDPSGTGMGNPGYLFITEIDASLKFDRPGVVGMANSGPDTNGSQFFITYGAAAHLDGLYTIFGQVLSGMDVLEQLAPRNPEPGQFLPSGDELISVTIEER